MGRKKKTAALIQRELDAILENVVEEGLKANYNEHQRLARLRPESANDKAQIKALKDDYKTYKKITTLRKALRDAQVREASTPLPVVEEGLETNYNEYMRLYRLHQPSANDKAQMEALKEDFLKYGKLIRKAL